MIQVQVNGVKKNLKNYQYEVFLYDTRSARQMSIWVDAYIADILSATLQGKARPLTAHDLVVHMIRAWGARLVCVIIDELGDDSFRAYLILETADGTKRLVSRPSDAIIVALRMRSPIYVEDALFNKYATPRPEDQKQLPPKKPPSEAEQNKLKPFYDAFKDEDLDPH